MHVALKFFKEVLYTPENLTLIIQYSNFVCIKVIIFTGNQKEVFHHRRKEYALLYIVK